MKEIDQGLFHFSRSEILRARARAVRRGVWFRVLSRVERGLVDLSLKLVWRARSLVLVRSLSLVVKKLLDAMESEVARQMKTVGYPLAQRLSRIALGWGHGSAGLWVTDVGFVRYLAITFMNGPS